MARIRILVMRKDVKNSDDDQRESHRIQNAATSDEPAISSW